MAESLQPIGEAQVGPTAFRYLQAIRATLGAIAACLVCCGTAVAQSNSPAPMVVGPSEADAAQRAADERTAREFFSRLNAGTLAASDLPQRIVIVLSVTPLNIEYQDAAELRQTLAPCDFTGLGVRIQKMAPVGGVNVPVAGTSRGYLAGWRCRSGEIGYHITGKFELAAGKLDKVILAVARDS